MDTKLVSGNDLLAIRLGLVGISLVSAGVNTISVLSIDSLADLVIQPSVQSMVSRLTENGIVDFLSRILPFPFLVAAQAAYSAPLFKAFWNGRRSVEAGRKASHALIVAPVASGVITFMGWVIGVLAFLLAGPFVLGSLPLGYYLQNLVDIIVLASLSFLLSYYIVEAITRGVLVPRLFRENEVLEIRATASPRIGRRLVVFALAIGVAPALMFTTTIYILNNGGDNAIGMDLTPILIGAMSVLASLIIFVTWLKARAIQVPLEELQAAASRLAGGDFGSRITVSSDDEIGAVGGALNDMARGLEERERMRALFGRAVDPRVRDQLMAGLHEGGGMLEEATVVFLDLEGFTSISEGLPPDDVVVFLNAWFEAAASCIEGEGGLVNKFIGDGLMAVFGVPRLVGNHAERALRAVESLQARLGQVSADLVAAGLPTLRFRAGVHTGIVLAGIVGSRARQEYTVIGDAVNVAARLEPLGKDFRIPVVVSAATKAAAESGRSFIPLGSTSIRGKKQQLELFGLEPASSATAPGSGR